jgi:RHS repeat-associated protein
MARDLFAQSSRVTQRAEPEYISTWSYDAYASGSACTAGIGKLCEAAASNGLNRKLVYDALGRPTDTRTSISSGPSFASTQAYDAVNGRLISRTYPTGLAVNHNYTSKGFLASLTLPIPATVTPLPSSVGGTAGATVNLAANSVLWQAQAYSAWGQPEQQAFGNGVSGKTSFDGLSGHISAVTAGTGASTSVLSHAYSWDSVGHLSGRIDHNGDGASGAVSESFEHDAVGRLSGYSVASPAIPGSFVRSVSLQYNALGALLYKSDSGNYSYPAQGPGAVRPHAVQSTSGAATSNYGYDANGNLTSASSGKYRSIAYTSFNLPDSQQGIAGPAGGPSYTWRYDEDHKRVAETRSVAGGALAGTRSTWLLHPDNAGGLGFESELNSPVSPSAANPAASSQRHYLHAGGNTVGVLVSSAALPALAPGQTAPTALTSITLVKLEYWHEDHLGSLAASSDHAGALTQRYAYDPFGQRRYSGGNGDPTGALAYDWSPAVNAGSDRGFTGHEHLDDLGLIHMNGRLYDPRLARFVQADPNITLPSELQSYDRYSYVMNEPLSKTDPSGLDILPGATDPILTRLTRSAANVH